MRTIITALVAASTLAQDMGDIQREIENLERDIQNIPEEASKAFGEFMEDVECWWADRTPVGSCWKRERHALEDACWNEGKFWLWNQQRCVEQEEGQAIQKQEEKDNCAKEGSYWNVAQESCAWGTPSSEGWKYEAEQDCWSEGKYWVRDWEQCVDFEKGSKYEQEQVQKRCLDEGNAWNENGWCEWKMLMRKAPHFSMQQIDLKRGATFERYFAARYANASAPVQAWKASFNKWTATQARTYSDKYWCHAFGFTWDEAKKVCDFTKPTTQSLTKVPHTQTRPQALIEIEADINLTELEQIATPVAAGYEELSKAMQEYEAQVAALQQQWQPFFEQWWSDQERIEMEAAQQVAQQLVDNVYVNGNPLRDIVGSPEDWMMARRVPGSHTNARSLFALNKVFMASSGDVAHVHISLPEEEEINAFLQQVAASAENVGQQLDWLANTYGKKAEDLLDDAEDDFEDVIEDAFENVINPIGDLIKSTIANNTTVTVNGNEVPIQLAAKKRAAAEQSNYGTAFAGFTFGVIATLAAGAMVMTCSKKRVAANQEPFL